MQPSLLVSTVPVASEIIQRLAILHPALASIAWDTMPWTVAPSFWERILEAQQATPRGCNGGWDGCPDAPEYTRAQWPALLDPAWAFVLMIRKLLCSACYMLWYVVLRDALFLMGNHRARVGNHPYTA